MVDVKKDVNEMTDAVAENRNERNEAIDKELEESLVQEDKDYQGLVGNAVREGVDALVQADHFKQRLGDIIEATHERLGVDKSELRHKITKAYKMQYDTENFIKEKIKNENTYEFLEDFKA